MNRKQKIEKRIDVVIDISDETMNYGEGWEAYVDPDASVERYLSFAMVHISKEFPDYSVSVKGKDFTGLNSIGQIDITDERDPLIDEDAIENDKMLIEELIGEAYDREDWAVMK